MSRTLEPQGTLPEEAPPPDDDLPAGLVGAIAETALRAAFFYPGVLALGLLGVGLQEGWAAPPLLAAGLLGVGLVAAARRTRAETLGEVAVDMIAPVEDAARGPPMVSWLFDGIFSGVRSLVAGVAEAFGDGDGGCLGVVASFGIALVVLGLGLGASFLALPLLAFLWSPSWGRALLVLLPPLPCTAAFALVRWLGLRRRMRERDVRALPAPPPAP